MARIDQETVNRILDTADIVEVVSDFVKLKRRGANYIGLCPFHNERTPSFSVSKAKGLCKCFSCGKGGSAVGFIMELEQMTYVEALRYLAAKYNIEIKEKELTDAERQAATERESMLAINQVALSEFEKNLTEDPDGIAIGLSYFRERGINDLAVKRFHLGYSLDRRDALYNAAIKQGYSEKYLVDTGLCIRNDRGQVYDRFKGRVIYPVFGISGKVVAFGGRTLRSDKAVAKYVNSPESAIYSKSNELYGLYQAKQSIVRKNKCILVEGYMDVISMSQSGIENVVASSGTSLTEGQIRLIHRFTENVTVIYDSDPAGIKASLRGIDMLLSEGMKIKVLLLPDGDDPDSFAQNHTTEEVEAYIEANETDFIRFKTRILLEGAENDPIKRTSVIKDIVKSIACIPDNIARTVYISECSRLLEIDEKILKLEVDKASIRRQNGSDDQTSIARDTDIQTNTGNTVTPVADPTARRQSQTTSDAARRLLASCEKELLRYILKYGMVTMCDGIDGNGNTYPLQLIDYVCDDLAVDGITWSVEAYDKAFREAADLRNTSWEKDRSQHEVMVLGRYDALWQEGMKQIQATATDMSDIKKQEQALKERCTQYFEDEMNRFADSYLELRLASSPDDDTRRVTTDLVSEPHQLSKVHTKYTKIETERDRLVEIVPKAIAAVKDAHLAINMKNETDALSQLNQSDPQYNEKVALHMKNIDNFARLRMELARNLGERVIVPRR